MSEHFDFLILNAPDRIRQQGHGLFGARLEAGGAAGQAVVPPQTECVIISAPDKAQRQKLLRAARQQAHCVLLEVSSAAEAKMAGDLGFDGVVAKTPLASPVPIWGSGEIGLHSAAAWYAAGAAGVVLNSQDSGWHPLAQQFRTMSAMVRGLRDSVRRHAQLAKQHVRLEAMTSVPVDAYTIEGLNDGAVEAALASGKTTVVFSGISDSRAASMAAIMAAPLAEKDVRIGIVADAKVAEEANKLVAALEVPFDPARAEDVLPHPAPVDVAIVGMGCLLPKAPNIRAFWHNILNKVDCITDIPKERFNIDLYYDPDRKKRDKMHSRWGGFIDPVPFDPMRFGIPPNALTSIDPLQLLALVTVDQALQDAGYQDGNYPREKTSVILGLSGGLGDVGLQYAVRSSLQQFIKQPPEELMQKLPEWTEDSFAGLLLNVAAGRVANRFDLGGVNFSVDAACASSLAAVYLAARELSDHSSDMVIVGGVDTAQSPFGFMCFAKAQALSGRGRCRTFDESADGIAISEGITMMVVKRLEDAEHDGDRIYAVIKGVAGSSDGKGRSMTAPRLEGQILALKRAYAQAGIRPSTVGLIEAHGTGTALGDASELAAVDSVFLADGAAPQSCAVGSVKSLVGHTKSSAGVTGLMKVALALYHKVLPPTIHVEKPNPKLLEAGTPMFVNTEALPWVPPPGLPRRAGVSAFGFGGTNFHAVVEEFLGDLRPPADIAQTEDWPAELFIWNDPTPAVLAEAAGLQGSLRDLAWALACNRTSVPSEQTRLAIIATSVDDLKGKLAKASVALEAKQSLNDSSGIYLAYGPPKGKVAFLFPGQGSQKTHMLRDLALYFAEFRRSFEQSEGILVGRFPKKLSQYIYPPPAFSPDREKLQNAELTDTVVAQPALGVVEIALCRALERLGVKPDMTAGHSYGEYVALAAAGVISDTALFDLSECRGRAIKHTTKEESGTMAAVAADAAAISNALNGSGGVTLANHNSPRQTVISGSRAAVAEAIQKLESAKLTARPIPVACAFHSPLMEPARKQFGQVLAKQTYAKPTAAVYSNTLGARYPEDPKEIAALLESHLVRPVKFVDQIRAMYEDGARVFVEVGPKGVLTGLSRQILEGKDARFIQIDSDRQPLVSLLQALAQLAAEGVPVDAAQLLRGRNTIRPAAKNTGWMVNALTAFPSNKPPQAVEPVDLVLRSQLPPPVVVVQQQPTMSVTPPPQPAPALPHNADAVMLQFQQLMKQLLQTQTTIMTAYLQGAAGMPVAAIPAMPSMPMSMPAPPAMPAMPTPLAVPQPMAMPAPPAPAPVVAPAPVAAALAAARRDFIEDLRRIASERTGYPPEMLDLDAGIESDLGIDSIKRVEILTAMQKMGSAAEQQAVQAILNKLTAAKTLREIATLIEQAVGPMAAQAAPATAAPAPLSAPAAAPVGAGARDYVTELREVAAERTGYPPEMLDLDAGIESDLGIDSIKRVEILTVLQRRGTPQEQERLQTIMNRLTSAKTLREIAGILAEGAPAATTPAATPAAPVSVPASVAAAPTSSPTRDFTADLVRIASERTGYEPDMLGLDAGIEADLGIDSIKRVEILTALQQLLSPAQQPLIQAVMEKLTSARTLREIADRMGATLGGESKALPQGRGSADAAPVPRFILTAAAKPRRQGKPHYYPGRVSLITDDETGIASGVADELKRAGEHPLLLRHSPDATISAGDVFTTDLTDPAAVETLIVSVRQQYGRIGAIIHLLPLRSNASAQQANMTEWRELVRTDIRSLYVLARAAETDLKHVGLAGGGLFAAVTARGGEFGLRPNGPFPPTHFGVADFTKTLSLELNGVQCKVVDLDPTDPVAILQQKLIDELTSTDDTLQVGLPGDRRLTVVPQIEPVDGQAVRPIDREWVILLTGGARGVTAEIARQLAERYQPTLILAGASPLPAGPESADTAGVTEPAKLKAALMARLKASSTTVKPAAVEAALHRLMKDREILQNLETLRKAGARIEYHSIDVREENEFGALIDRIYQEHGRLDAVIHGAGIIEDKLIKDKTPKSFDKVVHTKADSAFLLSRKLRPEGLRCLLFMSSVTAAFGNRGQADYAAANGIMNALAVQLTSQWPARVVAMNWGPWAQSGMVSEEVRQQFLSRGIQMIPLEGGAEAALREMEAGPPTDPIVALGEGPWREIALPSGTPRVQMHVYGSLK